MSLVDLYANCSSLRWFSPFSPQRSFHMNSNTHAASALTLFPRCYLAGVTLWLEVPLPGKPNAADCNLFCHHTSAHHAHVQSPFWHMMLFSQDPFSDDLLVVLLLLWWTCLALVCPCLADPQSIDRTIVLHLFPTTCLSFSGDLSKDRHASACAANSKHHRTRPRAGPWRVTFTHMTRDASLTNVALIFSPSVSRCPWLTFLLFHGWIVPIAIAKDRDTIHVCNQLKTPPHAALAGPWRVKFTHMMCYTSLTSVTLVFIFTAGLLCLPPNHL